jgi:hypothetical protein
MALKTGSLSYIAVVFQLRIGQPFLPFGGSNHLLSELERNQLKPQFPDQKKEVVELDKP